MGFYDKSISDVTDISDISAVHSCRAKNAYRGESSVVSGYRYYDTNMGRWLNRDPTGERGGLNAYGFVDNSAILTIDPYSYSNRREIMVVNKSILRRVVSVLMVLALFSVQGCSGVRLLGEHPISNVELSNYESKARKELFEGPIYYYSFEPLDESDSCYKPLREQCIRMANAENNCVVSIVTLEQDAWLSLVFKDPEGYLPEYEVVFDLSSKEISRSGSVALTGVGVIKHVFDGIEDFSDVPQP